MTVAKRVITAVLLVLISLLSGIGAYFYVKDVSEEIIFLSERLTQENSAGEDITKTYSALKLTWNRHSRVFSVVLKHSDADEISRCFIELEKAVEYNDTGKIHDILIHLTAFVRVVLQGEAPTVENIF